MRFTKSLTMMAAALLITVSCYAKDKMQPLAIGAAAPATDAPVAPLEGDSTTLADIAGEGGLLVIFSCNTCPWVIKWQDRYNEIAAAAKAQGVGVVYLNSNEGQRAKDDSVAAMKAHAEKFGYDFTYAVDKDHVIADAFGATKTPDVFLFDKDLKLVYRGAIDDSANDKGAVKAAYLADALAALKAGTAVPVATTASLGCSIKR